ncbi:hypothetical protein K438DRAFT_1767364 [Mycena galopus ATCC 62051]|nr:hypothetical protein K438DRAFT_1767364 [Mycena galopus ATCC 62051]
MWYETKNDVRPSDCGWQFGCEFEKLQLKFGCEFQRSYMCQHPKSKLSAVPVFPITAVVPQREDCSQGHVPFFNALAILLAGHPDLKPSCDSMRGPTGHQRMTHITSGDLCVISFAKTGYLFDTSGFGEDLEVEITQLSSERTKAMITDTITSTPSSPSPFPPLPFDPTRYPFVDLSTLPTQTPAHAPDTLAISRTFPLPHPSPLPAPFVVRDINFRIAANGKREVIDDKTHHAIGNSGANKENDNLSKPGKSTYNGDDLIGFARACVNVNLWLAGHGKKGLAWEETLDIASKQKGFHHVNMSASTLQHKCKAMIGFKKDPKGKNKNLAKVIGVGTSAAITIVALLERMETQYDEAKDKSDDAKAVIKKKNDADHEGGEAIRQASLRGMCRKRSLTPESDDSDTTEPEADEKATSISDTAPDANRDAGTPATTPKTISASSSVEIVDSTKDKKPTKRRRLHECHSASSKDALIDLFREENQCRTEHDNCVATSLNTFVKDSREQKAEFTSLLRDLIASDRSN